MMAKYVVALTTVAKRQDAEKMAKTLVQEKLAACVNILPGLISHYPWKGKLCRGRETLLLIKTKSTKIKSLEKHLHHLHPYEVPEFIVLPISSGSQLYLRWIDQAVDKGPSAALPSAPSPCDG